MTTLVMVILAIVCAALIPFTPPGLRYVNVLCIVLASACGLILGIRSLADKRVPRPREATGGLLHPETEDDLLSMLAPPPRPKRGRSR